MGGARSSSDADLHDLAAELSAGRAEPFGAYVFAADDPRSALARRVEEEVFDEVFGNPPELLAAEYGAYEDATVFFCVVDHVAARPAGMKRVIVDSPAGLKTLADIEQGPWSTPVDEVLARTGIDLDPARTVDVATLGVGRDYRGRSSGLVNLALNQITVRLSLALEARWWITILDVVVLDLYQQGFAEPWSYFTGIEPLRYLDSPLSVPVYGDVEAWCQRVALRDPGLHDLFVHGVGLEASVAPVDLDAAVAAVHATGWRPPMRSGARR
jgi:hypothetical protein